MPIATVRLQPGVNVEATPGLQKANYVESNLIRFRGGLAEKLGGWQKWYPFSLSGVPRALHAWQDLNATGWLGVGTTVGLNAIDDTSTLKNISPQTLTTDGIVNISTTSGSALVSITDANTSGLTSYDVVTFQTPVAIGGIVLSGSYQIDLSLGATQYQITASSAATATRANKTITGATAANPCVVTAASHGFSDGDLIYISGVSGMTELNGTLYEIDNSTTNTFELVGVDSSAYTAYTSGGVASPGHVPVVTTTSGSANVTVTISDHGLTAGDKIVFPLSISVGGVTINGTYVVTSVASADQFSVTASVTASSTATASMNSGEAEFVYTISIGPTDAGTGYGIGGYGDGGYGTGTTPSVQTGDALTASDWALDNWGEILVACPQNGMIYTWSPSGGFANASPVANGPSYNTGAFVSTPARIMVAYGSTVTHGIGVAQDPLVIRCSDIDNFEEWTTSTTNQARTFRIPNGSRIVRGIRSNQKNLIWTDVDLWSLEYINFPLVFRVQRLGPKAGLAAAHAVAELGSDVYWMSRSNFFVLSGNGLAVLPCSVWDVIFQDLDTANIHKCVAAANTAFSEIAWFYPSLEDATGEPTRYVKYNVVEKCWDYGTMGRTAAIDQSELGMPIMATASGIVYQHEESKDADGAPMAASFTTGYFEIAEGQQLATVDWLLPDFKWDSWNGAGSAELSITVSAVDYLGDTERTDGPFTVTKSTLSINPRIRGRFMSVTIASNDVESFWRIGAVKYRYAPDGRR